MTALSQENSYFFAENFCASSL